METDLHKASTRGSTREADPDHGLKQNVADLVRIANFAHRQNMGGLVWFGWCPPQSGKKVSWLAKGSHGLMMSKHGAYVVRKAMHAGEIKRGHIDLVLLDWLKQPCNAEAAQACYTYPALGGLLPAPEWVRP